MRDLATEYAAAGQTRTTGQSPGTALASHRPNLTPIRWLTGPHHPTRIRPAHAAPGSHRTFSPPGVIGGTVIRCARRSAGIGRHDFAYAAGVDHRTMRDVELGEIPLYCVPYTFLQRVADELTESLTPLAGGISELVIAAYCDLLVTALLCDFEDFAEVPPIDQDTVEGKRARELLAWALRGVVPDRYQPAAAPGCLLTGLERLQIAAIARGLAAGAYGAELTGFGNALTVLATGG